MDLFLFMIKNVHACGVGYVVESRLTCELTLVSLDYDLMGGLFGLMWSLIYFLLVFCL